MLTVIFLDYVQTIVFGPFFRGTHKCRGLKGYSIVFFFISMFVYLPRFMYPKSTRFEPYIIWQVSIYMNNTIYVRLDCLVSISNGKQHRVVWYNKESDHHKDRDITIIVTETSM